MPFNLVTTVNFRHCAKLAVFSPSPNRPRSKLALNSFGDCDPGRIAVRNSSPVIPLPLSTKATRGIPDENEANMSMWVAEAAMELSIMSATEVLNVYPKSRRPSIKLAALGDASKTSNVPPLLITNESSRLVVQLLISVLPW